MQSVVSHKVTLCLKAGQKLFKKFKGQKKVGDLEMFVINNIKALALDKVVLTKSFAEIKSKIKFIKGFEIFIVFFMVWFDITLRR